MSLVQGEQLDQQLLIQCTTKRNGFTTAYQLLAAYSAFYENPTVITKANQAINPTLLNESAQLWQNWPWKQLSQWKEMARKETLQCFEQSLDMELLRLEMGEQQARRATPIPATGFLSEQLAVLLEKERGLENGGSPVEMGEWNHFASNVAVVRYLYSTHHDPFCLPETSVLSAQQSLHLNRLLLRLGHSKDPALLQTIIELLVGRLAGPTASRSTSSEFTRHCLHYQLELLRSSFPEVPITPNHRSLLLLELSHGLFDQGFTKSALSTIRCAPLPYVMHRAAESLATSPTMKGVCRLEELKLTSANEDESKRFTILQAMCSILLNGREDFDGDTLSLTNPSQSFSVEETLTPELATLCKRSG